MSKFAPSVVSAVDLANFAADQCNDPGDFPQLFTDDFVVRPEIVGKWFVTQWPDHCVTQQHLGDATIYGPYDTQAEALAAT